MIYAKISTTKDGVKYLYYFTKSVITTLPHAENSKISCPCQVHDESIESTKGTTVSMETALKKGWVIKNENS